MEAGSDCCKRTLKATEEEIQEVTLRLAAAKKD